MIKSVVGTILVLILLAHPVLAQASYAPPMSQLKAWTAVSKQTGAEAETLTTLSYTGQTPQATYVVTEQSLARAGEALIKFRNMYYLGFGLQVVGVVVSFVGGLIGSIFGGLMALGGSIIQLVAFWNVGIAGDHLIQASR